MPPRLLPTTQYTIVRHSAWTAKRDGQFARGLEPRGINTFMALHMVEEVGGLVFLRYKDAEDYAMKEMYPDNAPFSFTPRAPGTFTFAGELEVYVPVPLPGTQVRVTVTDLEGTVLDSYETTVPHDAPVNQASAAVTAVADNIKSGVGN